MKYRVRFDVGGQSGVWGEYDSQDEAEAAFQACLTHHGRQGEVVTEQLLADGEWRVITQAVSLTCESLPPTLSSPTTFGYTNYPRRLAGSPPPGTP